MAPRGLNAEGYFGRGSYLASRGQYREAIADYDRALELRPSYVEALNNRGLAFAALGNPADALASYDAALEHRPDYLRALNNRGLALAGLGRHEEAVQSYERALAVEPHYPAALVNCADALTALERNPAALEKLERALALSPSGAALCLHIGLSLAALGKQQKAIASLEAVMQDREQFVLALKVQSPNPEIHYNRAILLDALGERQLAIEDCERALTLRPDHLRALNLRAMILMSLDRIHEAQSSLERAIEVAESQAEPTVPAGIFRGVELFARAASCEWEGFADKADALTDAIDRGGHTLPFLYICFSDDPARQRRCAETFIRSEYPTPHPPLWRGERYQHERIRVAYVCGEFYEHPVAQLTAGLFERHDRQHFEITGVSLTGRATADAMTLRLERAFDRYIDARRLSAEQVAERLRELEIDIAVDLNGYTGAQRFEIFTRRPSPLQVGFLGYPGTTGSPHIDYVLADQVVIPPEARQHYTEQVVYLPGSFLITDDRRSAAAATPTRAELGLPEGAFVFCALHGHYKITPAMFEIWMRLLKAVPGSVLWLRPRNPLVTRNLQLTAQRSGVSPDRIVFAGTRASYGEYIARLRAADLFLDTAPYGGHSTAADVLMAGLPIVTLMGTTFAGRVGASILMASGLPELVTHSDADFEALALRLATDPGELAAMRAKIGRTAPQAPIFDTDRTRRHIESAYRLMWQRQQAGAPPAAFSVEPDVASPRDATRV